MALSKKHYVAVAKVLNKNAVEARSAVVEGKTAYDAAGIVANITADLAEVFAADNPNFDTARFINAALSGEGI